MEEIKRKQCLLREKRQRLKAIIMEKTALEKEIKSLATELVIYQCSKEFLDEYISKLEYYNTTQENLYSFGSESYHNKYKELKEGGII